MSDAFVVPAFFSLSGYFAELSLQRHSPWPFVRRKLLRLGVPLVTAVAAINPVYFYAGYHFHSGAEDVGRISFSHFYTGHWLGWHRPAAFYWQGLSFPLFSKLHLWFVESLFVYSVVFAFLPRPAIVKSSSSASSAVGTSTNADGDGATATKSTDPPPSSSRFCALAAAYTIFIGTATFAVRILYPIDTMLQVRLTYIKPARQIQYLGAFALGVWAARRQVPLVRSRTLEQRISALASLGIGTMLVGLSCIQDQAVFINRMRGGLTWECLTYSLAETGIFFVATTAAVSRAARRRGSGEKESRVSSQLGANAYGVYITHYFIVTAVQTLLQCVRPRYSATTKWAIVTFTSLPLSFTLSMALRTLPGAQCVL